MLVNPVIHKYISSRCDIMRLTGRYNPRTNNSLLCMFRGQWQFWLYLRERNAWLKNKQTALIRESTIIYKTIFLEREMESFCIIFIQYDHKHSFKTVFCFFWKINFRNFSMRTVIWVLNETLTLKTANQSLSMTVWLIIIHHHTKFVTKI